MIPQLYSKDTTTKICDLIDCIECFVEEERNGLFEVSIIYPNNSIAADLVEENIIMCNANDTLKNQLFRIYQTRRLMNNTIEVLATHITFDLAYDYVDDIEIENQSCEYALNTIFRNSQYSQKFTGHSDIINAQNYSMKMANCLEAIAGKQGSIVDTFGTGAELLRDNYDIHVLNKRGHDNGVSIEYAKNLTGFELEEDTSKLITRILPYAKYKPEEATTNEEVIVKAGFVDSPLINNYSHPYVTAIDYSDKFEDKEVPTESKLAELAEKEYLVNKVDIPKQNFKIEFIPLSKCVGYEGLEDKINLCDKVTIKDTRYNINTQAKVIRTVYNVLKDRYESMELGEPKTTLDKVITDNNNNNYVTKEELGDKVEDIRPTYPNVLPNVPILKAEVFGFASIEISWTFENQPYYQYEIYASKNEGFTPTAFDLIHRGQTSSFLFQAEPNETWYFKGCAVNTHEHRTGFSNELKVETRQLDSLENYFTSAAIGTAVVGSLTADYMTTGILKGHWIDAKNLSVTDGNGKRTLDIDSFGNVNLDVTTFKIQSTDIDTKIQSSVQVFENSILSTVSDRYATKSEVNQTKDEWTAKFNSGYEQGIVKMNKDGITVTQSTSNCQTQINSDGLLVNHSNGSYTNIGPGGMKLYESGTGYNFKARIATGDVYVFEGGDYTLTLPSYFNSCSASEISIRIIPYTTAQSQSLGTAAVCCFYWEKKGLTFNGSNWELSLYINVKMAQFGDMYTDPGTSVTRPFYYSYFIIA